MKVMNFSFRRFSIQFLLMEDFVDVAGICGLDEHSTSETFLLAIQILGSFLIVHELWAKVCMACMRFDGPWLFNTVPSRFFNLNSNQSIVNNTIPLLVACCGFFRLFFPIKSYGESIIKCIQFFFFQFSIFFFITNYCELFLIIIGSNSHRAWLYHVTVFKRDKEIRIFRR